MSERRLRALGELIALAAIMERPDQVSAAAIDTLVKYSPELSFACIYLYDREGRWRRVAGTNGVPAQLEQRLSVTQAVAADAPVLIENESALLVPMRAGSTSPPTGALVVGPGADLVADEAMLQFLTLAGQYIGTTFAIATIRAQGEKHVQIAALQDHALQTFFVIGLVARAALAELAPDQVSDTVASALVKIIDVATAGREHLREAIFALGHTDICKRGLVEMLQSLTRNFQERTSIEAEVIVTGTPRALADDAIQALHQAAAEALANIERHSEAGAVVLSLHFGRQRVTLSVHDDGVGVANPALERIASSATHFGLRGVGERIRHLGGTFVAKPSREGGFLVRTRLPLKTSRGE